MSSKVKTVTPFINRELLLKALAAVGCKYVIHGEEIHTERKDYYGAQKFCFLNGRYVFVHEQYAQRSSWGNIDMQQYKSTSSFISAVEEKYNYIYSKQLEELEKKRLAAIAEAERLRREQLAEQERIRLIALAEEERKKADEERQRLEKERKEYIEKQRIAIITNAKEQGYDIQETMVDNKIKLVLVKTTY